MSCGRTHRRRNATRGRPQYARAHSRAGATINPAGTLSEGKGRNGGADSGVLKPEMLRAQLRETQESGYGRSITSASRHGSPKGP